MPRYSTPIEKYSDCLDIKRDDLVGITDFCGCKVRGILPTMQDAKYYLYPGIVTSATKNSNAARLLSFYTRIEGLKCTIIIPKLKELSSALLLAKQEGAELIESKFSRTQYLDFLAKQYAKEHNYYYLEQGCSNNNLFNAYVSQGSCLHTTKTYDNVFVTVGTGTIFGGLSKGFFTSSTEVIGLSLVKTPEQIQKYLKKKFNCGSDLNKIILLPKQKNLLKDDRFDENYSLLAFNWLINNIEQFKHQKNLFWNTGNNYNAKK